jgi:hypothetical protein
VGRESRPLSTLKSMEIVLDITPDATGRLSGTTRPAGGVEARRFSGAMELLAQIEELCDPSAARDRSRGTHPTQEREENNAQAQ